jgi:predicted amidophosphoribosyltransferase
LRFWDEPHLCSSCAGELAGEGVQGKLVTHSKDVIPVFAAMPTNPDLVKLVGQFKYHGIRGLAWPLSCQMEKPLALATEQSGPVDALVPIPLHSRRRRARGFNQAEMLARLLAGKVNLPVRPDLLTRRRNTAQQARITTVEGRRRNLESAFATQDRRAAPGLRTGGVTSLGLVDDLVTSGHTAVAAAVSLRAAGWDVRWVLALGGPGHAKNDRPRVDTWEGGF